MRLLAWLAGDGDAVVHPEARRCAFRDAPLMSSASVTAGMVRLFCVAPESIGRADLLQRDHQVVGAALGRVAELEGEPAIADVRDTTRGVTGDRGEGAPIVALLHPLVGLVVPGKTAVVGPIGTHDGAQPHLHVEVGGAVIGWPSRSSSPDREAERAGRVVVGHVYRVIAGGRATGVTRGRERRRRLRQRQGGEEREQGQEQPAAARRLYVRSDASASSSRTAVRSLVCVVRDAREKRRRRPGRQTPGPATAPVSVSCSPRDGRPTA